MSIPVVYDTMLFLQAAVQPIRVHRTFRAFHEGVVRLCLSAELLAEVRDVLTRVQVRKKFPALTPEAVDAFISETAAMATMLNRQMYSPGRWTRAMTTSSISQSTLGPNIWLHGRRGC